MNKHVLRICGLLLCLVFLPLRAEVQVSIDRNPVQVNESFQLVFSLDSVPDREPDFNALQQHFILLDSSQSNSISIINGDYQRSMKYTLQLMPKQVGEYMVPAIRFGRERSKPFQVSVKPASMAALPHDQLVLELQTDKQDAYVQSQVIVSLRLLSSENITAYDLGMLKLESGDAVIEPLGEVKQFHTRIADKSYLVLEQKYALFPQQSGRLEILPVIAEVRLPSKSSFDPFQRSGEIRRIRSQNLSIEVAPIPAEFQAQEWLPANHIQLSEDWQGELGQLRAGEPLTRTLTLVADGLTAAQLPELQLSDIDGIKQYPDKPGLQDQRSDSGIVGTRQQKIALIPGAAGIYRIPEVRLQWWNLRSGRVETARLPARELRVEAAATTTLVEMLPAQEVSELAPTRVTVETNQFWVWLSLLLALGWGASLLAWWLHSRRRLAAAEAPRLVAQPSLRQARQRLRQACEDNNAAAARAALLAWGEALLAPEAVRNLPRLAERLGLDMQQQIDLLNQALYAEPASDWQGSELWRLCQSLEKNLQHIAPSADAARLMPLNPAA